MVRYDTALGSGVLFKDEESDADQIDALLESLIAWSNETGDSERALVACLACARHAEPRVRAAAITAVGTLLAGSSQPAQVAIAAVFGALSDSDPQVRESAEQVARLLRKNRPNA